jgi:predicted 2-oxoglutarate/Fe(II)-dependent dioxygenase YbiX
LAYKHTQQRNSYTYRTYAISALLDEIGVSVFSSIRQNGSNANGQNTQNTQTTQTTQTTQNTQNTQTTQNTQNTQILVLRFQSRAPEYVTNIKFKSHRFTFTVRIMHLYNVGHRATLRTIQKERTT